MVRKLIRKNRSMIRILHIFLSLAAWLWCSYILFFIHPVQWKEVYYLPLIISLFLTILTTTRLFTKKWIICVLIPLGVVSIIIIRIFLMKDYINPILITSLVATLIYFFTSGNSNAILPPKTSSINKSNSNYINTYAGLPQTNRPKPGTGN